MGKMFFKVAHFHSNFILHQEVQTSDVALQLQTEDEGSLLLHLIFPASARFLRVFPRMLCHQLGTVQERDRPVHHQGSLCFRLVHSFVVRLRKD